MLFNCFVNNPNHYQVTIKADDGLMVDHIYNMKVVI